MPRDRTTLDPHHFMPMWNAKYYVFKNGDTEPLDKTEEFHRAIRMPIHEDDENPLSMTNNYERLGFRSLEGTPLFTLGEYGGASLGTYDGERFPSNGIRATVFMRYSHLSQALPEPWYDYLVLLQSNAFEEATLLRCFVDLVAYLRWLEPLARLRSGRMTTVTPQELSTLLEQKQLKQEQEELRQGQEYLEQARKELSQERTQARQEFREERALMRREREQWNQERQERRAQG